jgi:hypothetical protein
MASSSLGPFFLPCLSLLLPLSQRCCRSSCVCVAAVVWCQPCRRRTVIRLVVMFVVRTVSKKRKGTKKTYLYGPRDDISWAYFLATFVISLS